MKRLLLLLVLISSLTGVVQAQDTAPVGHLTIPSQEIDEDIYFSELLDRQWDSSVWDSGNVAWLDQTGWINSDFNTALVSHTNGPLHNIIWLAVGDILYIEDNQYFTAYMVTETFIDDVNNVDVVVQQGMGAMLTLTICWGNHERYVVRAERIVLEEK